MTDAIVAELRRLGDKIESSRVESAENMGMLTERVTNLTAAVSQHVQADQQIHGWLDARAGKLEHFNENLKGKIAGISAAFGVIVALALAFAKEAIAAVFHH